MLAERAGVSGMVSNNSLAEMQSRVRIWPCETDFFYFNEEGSIAQSPTQLLHRAESAQPDMDAILSILQFGAIIPPLSPWIGVSRLTPGFEYAGIKQVAPIKIPKITPDDNLNPRFQTSQIEQIIDFTLTSQLADHQSPVLLFSGGVDSGFIATRLAALGYRDTLLINYSFGTNDPESKIAEEMACEIGLPFERVVIEDDLWECLKEPGQFYSQPFGDHSTVPTSALARALVERLDGNNRIIIDGTGADGAFGMLGKIKAWQKFRQVPFPLRHVASASYKRLFWEHDSQLERLGRISRRSIQLPIIGAVIAQNPLAGVFYSDEASERLSNLLENWIYGWAGSRIEDQIIGADLALTCANIFAQKAKPILQGAGHTVLYPFLDPRILSLSFSASRNHGSDIPKGELKKSLLKYVSSDMVYRPKSGFVDPIPKVFYTAQFLEYLDAVVNSSGALTGVLDHKKINRAVHLLKKQKTLPAQTLNLLWSIVFTDRWYGTLNHE